MPSAKEFFDSINKNTKNVFFDDLKKLAELYGWQVVPGKGSHYKCKKTGQFPMTIPKDKRKVKEVYVKKFLKMIEEESSNG